MITNFKLFENIVDDYSTWEIGDEIYCIDGGLENKLGHHGKLTVGKKYRVCSDSFKSTQGKWWLIYIDTYDNGNSLLYQADRFTKNPNHPVLSQKRFDL